VVPLQLQPIGTTPVLPWLCAQEDKRLVELVGKNGARDWARLRRTSQAGELRSEQVLTEVEQLLFCQRVLSWMMISWDCFTREVCGF
jgi:hypothetical protein